MNNSNRKTKEDNGISAYECSVLYYLFHESSKITLKVLMLFDLIIEWGKEF